MANFYDIVYRGKDAEPLNYNHDGEKWSYYTFTRRGESEADAIVSDLHTKGYEAKRVYVGKPRARDIDD